MLESAFPNKVRPKALVKVDRELERYAAVILDPTTPVWGLEIITNHPSAAAYFLGRLEYYRIPGRVIVKP